MDIFPLRKCKTDFIPKHTAVSPLYNYNLIHAYFETNSKLLLTLKYLTYLEH